MTNQTSNQCAKYTTAHVANYILGYFFLYNKEITLLKLQKLLYIAYGWNLVLDKENPRLFDEPIVAWKYGPVVPSVYYYFKDKTDSRNAIHTYVVGFDENDKVDLNAIPIIPEDDMRTKIIINAVLKKYGDKSGEELVNKLHEPNSPWSKTYNKNGIQASGRNSVINDEYIAERSEVAIDEYFKNLNLTN